MAFTFFFRDSHSIQQAIDQFIPYVSGYRRIKIWDAGSAHGPEPYTFLILLAEKMNQYAFRNVHMDATDIDETGKFGPQIESGIYNYSELSRIPKDIFEKYFKSIDDQKNYKISDTIHKAIKFTKHNILTYKPIDQGYHMIINKNVLLHFTPEDRIKAIEMYHRTLAPGGYFLTEQTQPLPDPVKHLFEKVVPDANVFKKI